MGTKILDLIKESIRKVGIKEVARRSSLAASTVSRIHSGASIPSLEVAEKISKAVGYNLQLQPQTQLASAPRLDFAKQILMKLKSELKLLGVQHVTIFGSVARGEDGPHSDIDICLDFDSEKPKAFRILKAEGRILEVFGDNKVDIISQLKAHKNARLIGRIKKDGIRVF
jgi:predicted nucleotidyltransferase